MNQVSIHEVGMFAVLAAPIVDQEGRILVAAGSVLTPALLRRLERLSISRVTIEPPAHVARTHGAELPVISESDPVVAADSATVPRDLDEMQLIATAIQKWRMQRPLPVEAQKV